MHLSVTDYHSSSSLKTRQQLFELITQLRRQTNQLATDLVRYRLLVSKYRQFVDYTAAAVGDDVSDQFADRLYREIGILEQFNDTKCLIRLTTPSSYKTIVTEEETEEEEQSIAVKITDNLVSIGCQTNDNYLLIDGKQRKRRRVDYREEEVEVEVEEVNDNEDNSSEDIVDEDTDNQCIDQLTNNDDDDTISADGVDYWVKQITGPSSSTSSLKIGHKMKQKSRRRFHSVCHYCGQKFDNIREFRDHKLGHKRQRLPAVIPTNNHQLLKYRCDYNGCRNTFATQSYLTVHKQIHIAKPNYRCDRCQRPPLLTNSVECQTTTTVSDKYVGRKTTKKNSAINDKSIMKSLINNRKEKLNFFGNNSRTVFGKNGYTRDRRNEMREINHLLNQLDDNDNNNNKDFSDIVRNSSTNRSSATKLKTTITKILSTNDDDEDNDYNLVVNNSTTGSRESSIDGKDNDRQEEVYANHQELTTTTTTTTTSGSTSDRLVLSSDGMWYLVKQEI